MKPAITVLSLIAVTASALAISSEDWQVATYFVVVAFWGNYLYDREN